MIESRGESIRLGVLIGGGGRTLLNIADAIARGSLPASIKTVIATRASIAGVERARSRGLHAHILEHEADADAAIERHLRTSRVDLLCLAGYMRHLRIPRGYEGRVMNVHPALLPAFGGEGMYGMKVHRAVIEHGCRVSGCTVHFVDEKYDNGPIIVQKTCPVFEDDTPESLASRVFELECQAYPEAIGFFAEGRLRIEGRRVFGADDDDAKPS